jgi:hypothetical protein
MVEHYSIIPWNGYNINTNLQPYRHGFRQSTRPIAFPPGIHPNFHGTYPVNRYRSVIPPWETQTTPINISNDYQLKTPSTETKDP